MGEGEGEREREGEGEREDKANLTAHDVHKNNTIRRLMRPRPSPENHTHLIAGVITDHVALATVDAHIFIDDGHCLLGVVQLLVVPDTRKSQPHHVLERTRVK